MLAAVGAVATEGAVDMSQPWFATPTQAQVFNIRFMQMPCPRGASPGQIGTATVIGGWVQRSFETSTDEHTHYNFR